MTKIVHIYFDFVCPFCFLGEHKLIRAIGKNNVKIIWHPYELSPGNQDTFDPFGKDSDKLCAIEKRILPEAKELGISMSFPKISPFPHTNLAFRGMQYAKEQNMERDYIESIFAAFFQNGKDIGKPEILEKLAAGIGLNADKFRIALDSKKYSDLHREGLRHSLEDITINLIPTYVIGNRTMEGIIEIEDLRDAILNSEDIISREIASDSTD